MPLINVGYIEVGDLPLVNGSIDHEVLQVSSCKQGSKQSVFLISASLQKKFKHQLGWPITDKSFLKQILKHSKVLLKKENWLAPTLTKWELKLQIPPLSTTDCCLVLKQMV